MNWVLVISLWMLNLEIDYTAYVTWLKIIS